jgi:hypothetical protein
MIQTYDPNPQVKRRRPWLPAAIAAGTLAIAAIIATVSLTATSTKSGDHPAGSLFAMTSPLSDAADSCAAGDLADNDHTLVVDMEGEEPGTGTASIEDVLCVLGALETPQAIVAQMEATRALDGMQSATWSTYSAKWTYHPDNGLDLIITQAA